MKILVLTSDLKARNGWGRYSADLVDSLRSSGVLVDVVDSSFLPGALDYRRNYLLAFFYAWKLRKEAKDCDIIHVCVETYSEIARWLSFLTGTKYIITAHGTHGILPLYLSWWKKFFHKLSFFRANKIVCISSYTSSELSRHGFSNLVVIHNGIKFDSFHRATIPVFKDRENIVLTVGALKERKGQHVSVEAFAEIVERVKDAKYYIVGNDSDTAYVSRLNKIVSDFGIADKVKFLSGISEEELRDIYARAKVFILASISENEHFEGFGLVYLEAGANGVPSIGSFGTGAIDAIVDGGTGFLVPQNDRKLIAKYAIDLLEQEDLWTRISTQSVSWSKKHDMSEVVKDYDKIYREI